MAPPKERAFLPHPLPACDIFKRIIFINPTRYLPSLLLFRVATYTLVAFYQFTRASIDDIAMAGGKGKSIGGKASGAKDSGTKTQKSHSAKAGLQVSNVAAPEVLLPHREEQRVRYQVHCTLHRRRVA